jgi:Xaa-Pro aminopeptidase
MSDFPTLFHSEFDSINTELEAQACIKTQAMINALARAAHLADAGFQAAAGLIKPGAKPDMIRLAIQDEIGAAVTKDLLRIKVIPGACLNYHVSDQDLSAVLEGGSMVFLEITGKYQDVFFSSSRVFPVGEPSLDQAKYLKHLAEASEFMRQTIHPGQERTFYLAESRGSVISPHGHGIGASLFEPPFISPRRPFLVQPGMVICLASFVQSPQFGVGYIKEMVEMTKDGFRRLSDFPLSIFEA